MQEGQTAQPFHFCSIDPASVINAVQTAGFLSKLWSYLSELFLITDIDFLTSDL